MDFKVTEVLSLAFSSVALFFTFRKDAHRITLEVTPLWADWIDVLGVGNDSSFAIGILSVGYFDANGEITWVPVGDFKVNHTAPYPIRIESRSLSALQVMVVRHFNNHKAPHGYCVQLESGRVYAIRYTAPFLIGMKFHISSLVSRLTAGRYAPWLIRQRLPGQ